MPDQDPPEQPPGPPTSPPPAPPAPGGEPLGANYTMFEILGRGAMGVVRRAVTTSGDVVAVKILRPEFVEDHTIVGRFLQERSILTSLNHVNVVHVRDLVAEGATLAIVMDLVVGPDLRTELKSRGVLPPAEAAALVAGVCRGLAAVHGVGVVHRDVKPENVLLERVAGSTVPKLNDFGVSKLVTGRQGSRNTSVIGTPDYMAPELIDDRDPSNASDLYSVGIMLYEALCGVTPFVGGSPLAVLRKHAELAPGRPPGMPDSLWGIITELLAKDPAARPASASLVASALESSLGALSAVPALPRLTTPPQADPDTMTYQQTLVPTTVKPAPAPATKSRRTLVIAAVAAVLVMAVAGTAIGIALSSGKAHTTTPPLTTATVTPTTAVTTAPVTPSAPVTTAAVVVPSATPAPSSAAPSAPPSQTTPSPATVTTTSVAPTTTKAAPNRGAPMPDLRGKSLADAAAQLDSLGVAYTTTVVLSAKAVDNTVKAQAPAPGKPAGTHAVLTVYRVPAITYLADVGALGNGPSTSAVDIGGTTYSHPVGTGGFDNYGCTGAVTWNYDLAKSYRLLEGLAGVTDDSDQAAVFRVEVFTDSRRVYNKTVTLGHPIKVDIDVTDALRLTITVTKLGCHAETLDSKVALADPQLLGLPSNGAQASSTP